jgi:DNA polymerase-3 subunit delta
MKSLTPDALHRHLAGGKRGGVYFVYGDEEFLKEEATSALVDAHLDPATRDFNYDQLRADDTTPETMASIIATPPMMAEWRVVVVRDVQAMGSAPRLRTTLETLLERPIPGLLLILTAEIPSGRAQFYENLKKKCVPVECVALSEADLPGWLMERARSRGFELRPEAARLAAGNIGSDLGVLLQELNKLYEFAGEKRVIDKAMVAAVVGSIARQNRWEWFDLVADRKFQDARRAIDTARFR